MAVSKNFDWINYLKTQDIETHKKLKNTIKKIETRIENSDYVIGNECRKALEYAFIICEKLPPIKLWKVIDNFTTKYRIDSTSYNALKVVQKLGNIDSHAKTTNIFDNESETSSLTLLKHTHDALITVFAYEEKLDKKELYNINFDYRVYIDKNKKIKIKKYDSDISSNSIESFTVGIIEFLLDKKHKFYIPHYQRDYSWDKIDIQYLFNDLKKRHIDGFVHHMGVIALSNNNIKDPLRVIDGQQRLTTFLMIARTYKDIFVQEKIPHKYHEFNEWEKLITNKYNNADNETLKSIQNLLSPPTNEVLEKFVSTDMVIKNYKEIRSQILTFKHENNISLQEQYEIFKTKFLITPFVHKALTTRQELEIFENLNSKGKTLSNADLIENYQIESIKENEIDREEKIRTILYKNISEPILNAFPKKDKEKIVDAFYKFYNNYLIYVFNNGEDNMIINKSIKKYTTYNQFKKLWIKSSMTIKEFEEEISHINKYLKIWLMLESKSYNNNKIFKNNRHYINTTRRKDVQYPLFAYLFDKTMEFSSNGDLLKYISKKSEKLFTDCAQVIEIYFVRLIGSGTGQSLSGIFNNAILKLKNNKNIEWYAKILWEYFNDFKLGKNKMPDILTFEKMIPSYRFASWAQQSILISVEKYLHNISNRHKNQPIAYDDIDLEIEHIVPKLPKNKNRKFLNYEETIEMIGNKTILDSETNKKLKNKYFEEKIVEYPKNTVLLKGISTSKVKLKSLFKYDKFEKKEIEKRSKEIAKIAIKGPFADFM